MAEKHKSFDEFYYRTKDELNKRISNNFRRGTL